MGRFAGKVAIVTGGARGIGGAIAARLASEGASVLVADLIQPADPPDNVVWLRTDVADTGDVEAAVAEAVGRWGRLDYLVNNAGVGAIGTTVDTGEELWDRVFAVNTRAVFLFCKAAIPEMRKAGGGAIVNIASISGMFGDYAMDAYNASKGAVVNYTRSLALDVARDNIRVNALSPGLVRTEMAAAAMADPVDREHWFSLIPMGRAAQPSEMAGVAAFLLSDDASYMTGAIVPVDGGSTAHTGQPNFPEVWKKRAQRQGSG